MSDKLCLVRSTAAGYLRTTLEDEQLSHRELEIDRTIDRSVAMDTIRAMRYLDGEDSTQPILLLINCNGGSVIDGLAIYDTMQALHAPVWTVCVGECSSMAAVILAGGEKGHRYALANAQVMIHDPLITGDCGGPALSVDAISKRLMRTRRKVGEILSQCTGRKLDAVLSATARDTFFDAKQAKAFGLVDEIIADWGELRHVG